MNAWIIVKNTARYPGIDPKMPFGLLSIGTLEEARRVAERLSDWNAGCECSYYVVGDPKNYE